MAIAKQRSHGTALQAPANLGRALQKGDTYLGTHTRQLQRGMDAGEAWGGSVAAKKDCSGLIHT